MRSFELNWLHPVDYEWALFLTVNLTSLMRTIPPQNYMLGFKASKAMATKHAKRITILASNEVVQQQ